jgi:hypothetical protein
MSSRSRRSLRKSLPLRRLCGFRTVFITRRYVFKLLGRWRRDGRGWWWEFLLRGLLSNMQEREFAGEDWPELCPVRFSIPGGFLVDAARPAAHFGRVGRALITEPSSRAAMATSKRTSTISPTGGGG